MNDTAINFNNQLAFVGVDHAAWTKNTEQGDHERVGPPPKGYFLLRTTHTSPYARKVRIAADVLGVSDKIIMSPADIVALDASQLIYSSPIARVPVLETDAGLVVFESRVIVEYLCALQPDRSAHILPTDSPLCFLNKNLESVADTIIGAALAMVMERLFHHEEAVNTNWIARQSGKVTRGLQYATEHVAAHRFTHSGCIALACALGYLDWRGPAWREDFSSLSEWFDDFSRAVASFGATQAET